MTAPAPRPVILAIDTATTRIVLAIADLDGTGVETTEWPAGYRHGETLLASLESFLKDRSVGLEMLAAIAVGTGPGAFTGLRVGIATAKGLAHGLGRPIIGVPTGAALLAGSPPASTGQRRRSCPPGSNPRFDPVRRSSPSISRTAPRPMRSSAARSPGHRSEPR
jgi:tRNA threonylcarbamoyl adenosine modification protein YeaZ